ncbi:UNVERIFIED_CONTAM: hypothetical protein Slati_0836700 [Sesamum latifolium]|uniref:Transposase n=1 Tax=Sesamum latifolium TaxID=2727402 RepID=A0AAW2XLV1_9LAMI
MGLGYKEIDACKNDCALFYKENEENDKCPICDESRWKSDDAKGSKIPHKILRYFPLKPRLQRLFMSNHAALNMRWHKERRKDEIDNMRHPTDSPAWKYFDEQYPHFSQDSRNMKLGLGTDGFTLWSNLGDSYSMWPVILVAYNLPPYECMKEEYLMMSLLILGPRSTGKDIDVYLRPLIDELKELWDIGIETYDFYAKEKFQMHVAIL